MNKIQSTFEEKDEMELKSTESDDGHEEIEEKDSEDFVSSK